MGEEGLASEPADRPTHVHSVETGVSRDTSVPVGPNMVFQVARGIRLPRREGIRLN